MPALGTLIAGVAVGLIGDRPTLIGHSYGLRVIALFECGGAAMAETAVRPGGRLGSRSVIWPRARAMHRTALGVSAVSPALGGETFRTVGPVVRGGGWCDGAVVRRVELEPHDRRIMSPASHQSGFSSLTSANVGRSDHAATDFGTYQA
jgi:hypothetical protein